MGFYLLCRWYIKYKADERIQPTQVLPQASQTLSRYPNHNHALFEASLAENFLVGKSRVVNLISKQLINDGYNDFARLMFGDLNSFVE